MKYLVYFLLLAVLCGLAVGFGPYIKIYGQVPQLLFLLALVWSLDKTDPDFLFVAFIAGLFMDVYSGSPLGLFTGPLLVVCLAARLVVENFLVLEFSPKFLLALLLPAQALFDACYVLSSWLFMSLHLSASLTDWRTLAHGFAVAWLYNLALLYPMLILAEQTRAFVRHRVEREFKIR